jgi:hypothetical protein
MLAREQEGYLLTMVTSMVTLIIIAIMEERGEKNVGSVNIKLGVEVGGG